jgi:hypothetical protein
MTEEYAKFYALTQGKIYSPSGAVAHSSFYTDFGVTRKEVGFALTTATTDVIAKVEEVIAHIQDNALTGDILGGVVAMCSPEFFGALIQHAKIVNSYQYYTSTQEPLRNRLGGADAIRRTFDWCGVRWIEVRDAVNGQRFIAADECYFIPSGTEDTFITYVAPSNKLDLANTLGEDMYLFQTKNPNGESLDLELEFSKVHLIRRPQVVVKATKV